MTSTHSADLQSINFGLPAAFEPFISAAREAAADLTGVGIDAGARVRHLGLAELFVELHEQREAIPLMLHLAETLAYVDVGAAWAGLCDAPRRLLGEDFANSEVAVPLGEDAASRRWVVWRPVAEAANGNTVTVAWPSPDGRTFHGPLPLAGLPPAGALAGEAALLGFPKGKSHVLLLDALTHGAAATPLQATAWRDYCDAAAAMVLGLLSGACRRLTQEAFTYARERKSAGKPIAQHQAVALRLANLAMNQQALALYATTAVEQGLVLGCAGPADACASMVDELAFQVACDAVQIAAAHGYVEGLPFKRLFEQVRTLSSALSSYLAAAGALGVPQTRRAVSVA